MTAELALSIYAAVVATIVLLIQVGTYLRDADDLSLKMSTGIVVGAMAYRLGTDHVVEVTVASRGGRPVGVSSLSLRVSGGKTIPLIDHMPTAGSRTLPAVLERGEHSTYWVSKAGLEATLRESGSRIEAIRAHLTDGSTVESTRFDSSWKRLGE